MKATKRTLSIILTLLILVSTATLAFAASTASGKCGKNAKWKFVESTGTLTISGSGPMKNYDFSEESPWNEYSDQITTIKIGSKITRIGNAAFYSCYQVSALEIPASVKAIGDQAFESCSRVKSITFSEGLQEIGVEAFSGLWQVKTLKLPASLTKIGFYAFAHMESLKSISINKKNPNYSIDANGVLYNKAKTTLVLYPAGRKSTSFKIPGTVKKIGIGSFEQCQWLKAVDIPKSVTKISAGAFACSRKLAKVTGAKSVTTLGSDCFTGCIKLTAFPFSNKLKTIGEGAFHGASLSEVYIPASVEKIGRIAFCQTFDSMQNGIVALTKIKVSPKNKYYASDKYGVLFDKKMTTLYQYPIANQRTKYEVPVSVKFIHSDSFIGCAYLKSVTLNKKLQKIGFGSFNDCPKLKVVNYKGTEKNWQKVVVKGGNYALEDATLRFI